MSALNVTVLHVNGTCISNAVASLLRRIGLTSTKVSAEFPKSGVAIQLYGDSGKRSDLGLDWVKGAPGRVLVLEPQRLSNRFTAPWAQLRLGQQISCPSAPPESFLDCGDRFFTEVVEIGLYGFERRVRYQRPLPPAWVGYIFLLGHILAEKTAEPSAVIARLEVFWNQNTQRDPFCVAAYALLHGKDAPAAVENIYQRYALASAHGDQLEDPPSPSNEKLEAVLIHQAHLAFAGGTSDVDTWHNVLSHLDRARGLFSRSAESPLGVWQLHPILLCAVARRIGRYKPITEKPVYHPSSSFGHKKHCIDNSSTDDHPPVFRLRANVLTEAAMRFDPPELRFPYDYSDRTDLYAIEQTVKRILAPILSYAEDDIAKRNSTTEEPLFYFCIRHDVDRPLTQDQLNAHLELERLLGCRSSWYFKRETFNPKLAEQILESGNEVGYHAELLSTGDGGFAEKLTTWLGHPPGLTCHGGLGSEFWRGRRTLLDALRLNVKYAEYPVGWYPHTISWTDNQNRSLLLTPLPVKFDIFPEQCQEHANWIIARRGLLILENHPDIYTTKYVNFIRSLVSRKPQMHTVDGAIESLETAKGLMNPNRLNSKGHNTR